MSLRTALWAKRLAIAALWLLLWQVAATTAGSGFLLCGPLEATRALMALLPTAGFWECVGASLGRIAAGFGVAAALGVVSGALAARFGLVREALAPLMHVVKGTPVVCVIALLLVWVGSNQATGVVVALVVVPPFYAAMVEAAAARSVLVDEMLRAFAVGPLRRLALFRWPEAAPFLRAAAKTAAGMAWKAGVAAELIGLPAFSIGEQVYLAKLTLDTPSIIAWTATVVLLGWASERLVVALVDASARLPRRWLAWRVRRAEALAASGNVQGAGLGGAALDAPAPRGRPARAERARCTADGTAGGAGAGLAPAADAAAPSPVALRFEGASKGFGGAMVVDGLTLEVPQGARVALMAPSGAGKTTLLRLACGLETPDQGVVEATGPLSVVFQEARLLEGLTARENLAVTAASLDELACGLGLLRALLPDEAQGSAKLASQLSGGMRRRVELARALAHPSSALLLDEAFSGLDAAARRHAAEVVARHLQGRALVMATHDPADPALLGAVVVERLAGTPAVLPAQPAA